MRLKFELTAIAALVAHARTSPDWMMPYGYDAKKKAPGLLLVKDSGIYLMSNGKPDLMPDGSLRKDGQEGSCATVHAAGHGPDTWTGGDDYVEFLELKVIEQAIAEKATSMVVNITASTMSVSFTFPPSADDTRAHIEKQMEKAHMFLPSPRHKAFKLIPKTYTEEQLKKAYPKAIVLNSMPIEAAVKKYMEVRA